MTYVTYYIYLHRCLITNKVYIGQTCQKPEYRWNQGKGYQESPLFYNAIQKYGWENFTHEILETVDSLEKANDRERYWICYYQSNNRDYGYNLNDGGNSKLTPEQKEERKQKLKNWRETHPKQAQKAIDAMKAYWENHPEEKRLAQKKATEASVKYWQAHPEEAKIRHKHMIEKAKEKTSKSVRCIETSMVYTSAREAARQTNGSYSGIGKVCTHRQKTSGGYHWEFCSKEKERQDI